MPTTFEMTQIGVARTPLMHRRDAPCQPELQRGVQGVIEIEPEYRACLNDLHGFERIWLLYIFDRNEGWRHMVKPPRGGPKRGLFATRSPHRPSRIGMTAVELLEIQKGSLLVQSLDLLDETPIIDIKPYLSFQDAHPNASLGWLDEVGTTGLRDLETEDAIGRKRRERREKKSGKQTLEEDQGPHLKDES